MNFMDAWREKKVQHAWNGDDVLCPIKEKKYRVFGKTCPGCGALLDIDIKEPPKKSEPLDRKYDAEPTLVEVS